MRCLALLLGAASWASSMAAGPDVLVNEYTRASNDSLLWGPYRSNLYFGVRPRGIPESLLAGLMWYTSDDVTAIKYIRHSCETGDDMAGHGWTQYDPRVGGTQVIQDRTHRLILTTEFFKGGDDDGTWVARVKGKPAFGGNDRTVTTLVFYAGLEGQGHLDLASPLTELGIEGDVDLLGMSPELGEFTIRITDGPASNVHPKSPHPLEQERPSHNAHYASLEFPGNMWQARDVFLAFAQDSVNAVSANYELTPELPPWNTYFLQDRQDMKGNLHYVQRAFQGEFEFDIVYRPKSDAGIDVDVDALRERAHETFDAKFSEAFAFNAPYDKPKYAKFAKEMLSSLMGGIGYFQGTSLVDRTDADVYAEDEEGFWIPAAEHLENGAAHGVEEGPYELFTAVPSRPFFPRGFYWDEGFHLLPVLEYDADLAMEIVKSWIALVDDDGWIAREQILGAEARSKVPEKFQTQFPHYANPPTLMLLFSRIVTRAHAAQQQQQQNADQKILADGGIRLGKAHLENPELLLSYAKEIYPKLKLHYDWFRTTQRGEIADWGRDAFSMREGYRWRGRTPTHCLTSGLDDYPRAPTPHTGELHVDLLAWMGMMTRAIKDIAHVVGSEDEQTYADIETAIVHNLDDLHWSADDEAYCDVAVDEYEDSVFACYKGYVTLLPLSLRIVPPDSKHIEPLLDLMRDPDALWSDFGLRSLAKNDPQFGTAENYWRGPIWINMNYMALDALRYYGQHPDARPEVREKAAAVYKELRTNIVDNVYRQWKKTGFAWEQYDALTGEAKGVKNFVGWTSLVVNIMAMPETL